MGAPVVSASIDPAEIARLSASAEEWWSVDGPYAALHRLNPIRLAFIREEALRRFGRDVRARAPFTGLTLLDIGCGGGIACEPMARLGFAVVGADASAENIAAAREHAAMMGLAIDYRATSVEALAAAGEAAFDVVLALEVVEHTADPAGFLAACAARVAPGGVMVVSTLNRTLKSLALGKVLAEYVLRWAPAGAHDWRRFVTPAELARHLTRAGLEVGMSHGVSFDPLALAWRRTADLGVNYMTAAYRAAPAPPSCG